MCCNFKMVFICEACDFSTKFQSDHNRHLQSKRHRNSTSEDFKAFAFACKYCNYGTNSSKSYSHHCTTSRHISRIHGKTEYYCPCGIFLHSQRALAFHVKQCDKPQIDPDQSPPNPEHPTDPAAASGESVLLMQMFQTLMEENNKNNQAMQENNKALIEAISSGNLANNTTNNNNTMNDHSTTNNNTMNLNVFLDEHCKDAMNLTDFFDKIKVHQSDLPDVLRVKNPKAISNILQRELGKLSITERPIHCTDVKRKKMFVKDNDKWTSEQGTDKIDKVINSTCAHQYNTWGVRVRNTDREDRAEQHYDDTAAMGAILGKQMDGWGEPGNRLMQEAQNGICNMVFLSKDDARVIADERVADDTKHGNL